MLRIFKYSDIQTISNISLTHDKEVNILIYRTRYYAITYKSYTLLKVDRFLAHVVYKCHRLFVCDSLSFILLVMIMTLHLFKVQCLINNNNNNNPICKAPECQKTSVALGYSVGQSLYL